MNGRTLLHYYIVEKLGEGGMGVVWKAPDTHLDRFVAVKVLPAEKLKDAERRRRFVQEAKAASACGSGTSTATNRRASSEATGSPNDLVSPLAS